MKEMRELNLFPVSHSHMNTHIWLESCGWSRKILIFRKSFELQAYFTLVPPSYGPHDAIVIFSSRNALINRHDTVNYQTLRLFHSKNVFCTQIDPYQVQLKPIRLLIILIADITYQHRRLSPSSNITIQLIMGFKIIAFLISGSITDGWRR